MSKRNAFRKMSELQLYPLAFNLTKVPTSWVSVRTQEIESNHNVDYVVIHKPKSKISFTQMSTYFNIQMLIWEIIVIASIISNYILITLTYLFVKPKGIDTWHFYAIIAGDAIYFLDLIPALINYFNHQIKPYSVVIPRKLASIVFDCILAIPVSTVYITIMRKTDYIFMTFRFFTLVRLYRIPVAFKVAENVVCSHRWLLLFIKYFMYGVIFHHMSSCIWFCLSNVEGKTWIGTIQNESYFPRSFEEIYLVDSYFTNNLFYNCGMGDVHPTKIIERIFAALFMCIGSYIYIFYISSIATLYLRKNFKYAVVVRRSKLILQHLKFINADPILIKKIRQYYDTFLVRKAGVLTTNKLKYLPEDIATSMNHRVSYAQLRFSFVLKDKPEAFLRNISNMVKHEFYLKGQDVYSEGKIKDRMVNILLNYHCLLMNDGADFTYSEILVDIREIYKRSFQIIVRSGILNVLSVEDHESPVISFGPGTCLGEVALIMCIPTKVILRAATFVEIQAIYTKDFIRCTLTHPDIFIDVREAILKRMFKCLAIDVRRSKILKRLKSILDNEQESKLVLAKFLSLYKLERRDAQRTGMEKLNTAWLDQNSAVVFFWDLVIVICVILVAIFYPYFAAYDKKHPKWFENVSSAIHVIFVVDIAVLLLTTVKRRGQKIERLTGILDYRLDTIGFILDVMSSFYIEVFSPLTPNKARFVSVLKLNRLLKVYRFFTFCDTLKKKRLLSFLTVSFIKFSSLAVLFVYWNSIALYMSTCFYDSCSSNGWYITKLKDSTQATITSVSTNGKFILSFLYSLSLSLSIGVGDILPKNKIDLILVILLVTSGKIIIGYFLADLIAALLLKGNSFSGYQELLVAVKFYAKKRAIPINLEKRIMNYYRIQWETDEAHQIFTGKTLDMDLPAMLKTEVKSEECLDIMRRFVIFDDLGQQFIDFLMKEARMVTLEPSEVVTYFGSINREMYIICKGYCLQQTESNAYKSLGPGSAIGFSSLLFGLPSMNNTYTATHCVLIYISVTTFNSALRHSASLYKTVYRARQMVLAKYNSKYEVRMIENPHYTKMRAKTKMKYKKFNDKLATEKSFINAYRYCVYNSESYGRLSNRAGRICFLKYLLMPIAILPNGPFIKCWQAIRLICSLIIITSVPLEYLLSPYRHELHYFLIVIDVIAYVDMYISMHIAYYGKQNQLIIHPWATAERYVKTSFAMDFIIWFPYAGLVLAFNKGHDENHSDFSHGLSPHFFHCSVHLIKVLDAYRILAATTYLSQLYKKKILFHCIKYILYSILLIHLWSVIIISNTCKYLHKTDIPRKHAGYNVTSLPGMIPVVTNDFNMYCSENSWLNSSDFKNYKNFWELYVAANYWVTQTLTGLGYGDVTGQNRREIIISVLIMLTGFLYYCYVLIDFVSRSASIHKNLLRYEAKYLHLMNYMKQEKVGRSVLINISGHMQYRWQRTRGYEVHFLLSTMNCALHEDTMLFIYESTLHHVPLFENLDHAFFRVFGKELREEYYMEGDIVLTGNDIVTDIYIVHKGAVEISSPLNMVPVVMGVGGIFGNVFESNSSLCGITVRALKHCDVLCLDVEVFRKILKDYPVIQKKIGAFTKSEAQKQYALANSFVDDGNTFVNPNLFWTAKHSTSIRSTNSLLSFCRQSLVNQSFIFNTFSTFVLVTAYVNSIITTYQFSFQHFSSLFLVTTVVIDIIFLLKFCMEVNNPFGDGNVYNSWYNRWKRTIDFFANLPFSYAILFVPFFSDSNKRFYFSILRLITLLRMYYIFQFFGYYRRKLMYNRFLLEFCILFTSGTLTIHLMTCFWYISICPFRKCSENLWLPTVHKNNSQEIYVSSLYLTVDLLTGTGTGDLAPKTMLQIITTEIYMVFSKIFLGYLIAQLITVLQSKSLALVKFEAIVDEIKNYYINAGIKESRTASVCKYLKLLWKRKHGVENYKIVKSLPRTLQIELMDSIYGTLLKNSYIFSQTERDFLRQLSLYLKHRTYFPGNYIVRDGDVDNSMYFIHRGDVQILTVNSASKETVHEILHESEVFGIVQGLFKEIPHHFAFRALSIVDLAILRLNDWEFLLDFFPKSKDVIYQRVEEIYYTI